MGSVTSPQAFFPPPITLCMGKGAWLLCSPQPRLSHHPRWTYRIEIDHDQAAGPVGCQELVKCVDCELLHARFRWRDDHTRLRQLQWSRRPRNSPRCGRRRLYGRYAAGGAAMGGFPAHLRCATCLPAHLPCAGPRRVRHSARAASPHADGVGIRRIRIVNIHSSRFIYLSILCGPKQPR